MDAILDIAGRKNIYVIEDAAHCPPARYKGKPVGTIGDMTCFSFYATKPLSAGEGGMVTTGNEEWAEKIRLLRLGISGSLEEILDGRLLVLRGHGGRI
jgi:perosamine synthetase